MPDDIKNQILDGLNDKQIEAVLHDKGPALVVAGPGSGKTKVLTNRIAYLITLRNVPHRNILCVTFTNKAAKEVQHRVESILEKTTTRSDRLVWGGTFHSICSKILRIDGGQIGIPSSFVIYDTDDQLSLIRHILKDFGVNTKQVNPNAVLASISDSKSELITPSEYASTAHGLFQKTVSRIYPEYQKRLRKNDALDFDDLLMEVVNLFSKEEGVLAKYQSIFHYILVDEYQDTNKAQYVITKLLAQKHKNLFVVGDMAQAIYSFRGADYRNILNFQRDYPEAKVYNLEQNYRSTQTILSAAKTMIKNNTSHIPLDLWTQREEDEKICLYTGLNEVDEASFVTNEIIDHISNGGDYNEVAVLYRTNAQSRTIEENLIKSNIPYRMVGGFRFYARKEVKDIISYLRVIHNVKDAVAWERIINTPTRGVGKKALEELKKTDWNIQEIERISKLPISSWLEKKKTLATMELMDEVLYTTKYIDWIDDGSDDALSRVENIKELRSVAANFNDLDEFLENVALIESTNKPASEEINGVTLMTVHASKGLEFPVVFIIGLEEGLFPHSRSLLELSELEEERRLCYVAITRAKDKVYLTQARSRLYFGRTESNAPSRFIKEIPQELIDHKGYKAHADFAAKVIDEFLDGMEYDRKNFNW